MGSDKTNLEVIDVDGAIRESAERAEHSLDDGDSRRQFLKKAGLTGGAVVGGGALLAGLVPGTALGAGRPPKSFGKGDIGILNYALTLEYLEAAFYNEAGNNNVAANDEPLDVILDTVINDENAHVKALKAALGGKAVKSPKFDFGDATSDKATFVATSVVLENTGVAAYGGQVPNVESAKVLKAAASIATIEARHAAVFGFFASATQDGITPDGAFDKALSAKKILKAVEKTGFITG